MSRIPDLEPAEMSAEQRRLHDAIAAKRHGHVRGPIAVWLRVPQLAERPDAMTSRRSPAPTSNS